MEAYKWKSEQEDIKQARHAIWTLMPHVKEAPTINEMLGIEEEKEDKKATTKNDLDDMKARMGK